MAQLHSSAVLETIPLIIKILLIPHFKYSFIPGSLFLFHLGIYRLFHMAKRSLGLVGHCSRSVFLLLFGVCSLFVKVPANQPKNPILILIDIPAFIDCGISILYRLVSIIFAYSLSLPLS